LFPTLLVLFALRVDPVQADPTYLDNYFRPQYTDLLTPYWYPVATTILGPFQYSDPWEAKTLALLTPFHQRMLDMGLARGVFPVLQSYEQAGYPILDSNFAQRQANVYATLWPENRNAATFDWSDSSDSTNLAGNLVLQESFKALFTNLTNTRTDSWLCQNGSVFFCPIFPVLGQ
jgi:hypothetical protein